MVLFSAKGNFVSLEAAFGILALFFALGRLAFIYAGLRKPERTTLDPLPWAIWTVLTVLTVIPQLVKTGWEWAILLGLANLTVNVVALVLALKYDRKPLKRSDWIAIVLASAGVVVWLVLLQVGAGVALFFSLGADFVGVCRTWGKAWRDPASEVLGNWVLCALASASALASAAFAGDMIVVWYPLYACNAFATIGIVIVRKWRCASQVMPRPQAVKV